jgi:hypothetical protein
LLFVLSVFICVVPKDHVCHWKNGFFQNRWTFVDARSAVILSCSTGPRLSGVFGRRAGAVASFTYSDALRKSGVVWNRATLDRWLANPESVAPDNDMPFRLADERERTAIIEYLQHISTR